jgi:N-methylhydantoinase B
MNELLLELVRANVREPITVEGDLYSLAACNEAGSRRLVEMLDEFDLSSLDGLGRHIIENSTHAMLEEIRALPAGVYRNHLRVDGYDTEIDLVAAMTIGPTGIDVDFTGTSAESPRGINVPLTYTQAYASFGVRCIVGSTVPNTAASRAVVRVDAPKGCILNAPPPCAVAMRHVIGQMLPDVVLGCLHQALPKGVPAEGTSCLWNAMLFGGHGMTDDTGHAGEPFTLTCFHNGGTGGRPGKDGLSATAFPSGVRNTPVEVNEAISPIIFGRKEYRADSAGVGEFRGGAGQIMEFRHRDGAAFAVSAAFDRVLHPPRGRNGGANGANGVVRLGSGKRLKQKGRQPVPHGDSLVLEMPGGGGFGDPLRRPPERVAEDVRNGLVSRASARRRYGVVLTGAGRVNEAETRRLRQDMAGAARQAAE